MTRITRAVTASDLEQLLASSDRASVAWNNAGQIAAEPVAFRFRDGKYLIGLAAGTLTAGQEVAVVIDEGPMYFDLRGVRVRGRTLVVGDGAEEPLEWFEVAPEHEVSWHYGTLRER